MRSTTALVRDFRTLRALVIGDAMLDTYFEGSAERLCSEAPVPVVRKRAEHRAPGGAANVAANLRALGARTRLIGAVGDDDAGRVLRTALLQAGVDISGLATMARGATLHKARILADGHYVVRFDDGDSLATDDSARADVRAAIEAVWAECDVVVLSDYAYGVLDEAEIEHLHGLLVKSPKLVVADSKRLERFRHLPLTVATPNSDEARTLVARGRRARQDDGQMSLPEEIAHVARQLLTLLATEHVAVTMAGDGVLLVSRDGTVRHLPARPVRAAHDVGAGDSFTAALALGLAGGASLSAAAQVGIEAAAIAVAKRHTSVVHSHELMQRVGLSEHAADVTGHTMAEDARAAALEHVRVQLGIERASGRTVVFTNGVFDVLHAGHVELLRRARALGDVLVVAVNSDAGARSVSGGIEPITGERDRLALVAALGMVDHAVLFDEATPDALIRALRPDVHVKGGDYAGMELPEAEAVRAVGGRVEIVPLSGMDGTREVIARIVARERAHGDAREMAAGGAR